MSDSNTHLNTKQDANASTPFRVIPLPGPSQAKTALHPNGVPAPGRQPLFRR